MRMQCHNFHFVSFNKVLLYHTLLRWLLLVVEAMENLSQLLISQNREVHNYSISLSSKQMAEYARTCYFCMCIIILARGSITHM